STKAKGAQEAHEAIRPTNLSVQNAGLDSAQKRLYDLIWKRTMASQMADAKLERTTAQLENAAGLRFVARGEMIAFDGFLKVYREGVDEEEEDTGLLPTLAKGDAVTLLQATAQQRFTRPPGRFTEATLVKALEELGIGRPSTYAPTITTVQKRGYIQKGTSEGVERQFSVGTFKNGAWTWEERSEKTGSDKGRMVPTDMGNIVTDFLNAHFTSVMDYQFTAKMESDFDLVADGKVPWTEVLADFYRDFNQLIVDSADADRASGQRLLGEDPVSGKPVYARIARYGAVVQMGETTEEEKPRFAGIPEGLSVETITLQEALALFALPRTLGTYEGQALKASIGRFGPYVQVGKTFVSLPADVSPYTVTEAQAIELIQAKARAAAAAMLATFDGPEGAIVITDGRYGPYIKYSGANYRIAKGTEVSSLDAAACLALIEEQRKNPPKGKRGGRTASKGKKS
ncbi:MAG: DNA topoisomerase, partial [Schleiferiaceae bacterium]